MCAGGSSTLVRWRAEPDVAPRPGPDRAVGTRRDRTVTVDLTSVGYAFPPARIRLALSTAYFPWVWPHSAVATLEVDPGGSALTLPVRMPRRTPAGPRSHLRNPSRPRRLPGRTRRRDSRPERTCGATSPAGMGTGGRPALPAARAHSPTGSATPRTRPRPTGSGGPDPLSAMATSQWTDRAAATGAGTPRSAPAPSSPPPPRGRRGRRRGHPSRRPGRRVPALAAAHSPDLGVSTRRACPPSSRSSSPPRCADARWCARLSNSSASGDAQVSARDIARHAGVSPAR